MKASEAAKHSNIVAYVAKPWDYPEFFYKTFTGVWVDSKGASFTESALEDNFHGEWEPWCRKEVEPEPEPSDPALVYSSSNVCVTEYKKPIRVHVAVKGGIEQTITDATIKVEHLDKNTITWSNATESLCVNEDCIQFIKTWESKQ